MMDCLLSCTLHTDVLCQCDGCESVRVTREADDGGVVLFHLGFWIFCERFQKDVSLLLIFIGLVSEEA